MSILSDFKHAWGEAGAKMLREDYEKTFASLNALPKQLQDRAYSTLLDSHDLVLSGIGNFENVSTEGILSLAKAAKAAAKEKYDLDLAAAYGMACLYMWLESRTMSCEDGQYVHYRTNLMLRATRVIRQHNANSDTVNSTYEQWYLAFKRAAAQFHPGLALEENNQSLIDFMNDTPLKQAFEDGVDPSTLAKEFAEQFDPSMFGR